MKAGTWGQLAARCTKLASAFAEGDEERLVDLLPELEKAVGATRMAVNAAKAGLRDEQIICAGCRHTFTWRPRQASDYAPRYCTPICKTQTRSQRRAEFDERLAQGLPLCPHPLKRAYTSWDAADAAVAVTPDPVGGLGAYECVCGALHIGHAWRSRRADAS